VALLYTLGVVVLLGGTGLCVYFAGWGVPSQWPEAATSIGGRAVLALLGVAALGGGLVLACQLADRLAAGRAIKRPGPKGEISISPRAIRQLAAGLLCGELGLTRFRVRVLHAGEGLALKIRLQLPPGEPAPELAERIQTLLAQEIEAKAGLPVEEVALEIRGTAHPASPTQPGEAA